MLSMDNAESNGGHEKQIPKKPLQQQHEQNNSLYNELYNWQF